MVKLSKVQKEKFMQLLREVADEQLRDEDRVGNIHFNTDEAKSIARDTLQGLHTFIELRERLI
jgi:hypothetical protein|tara:strand:- start:1277 stop:1465 length:189 start_codon:yes stop_codon:yes gene_type:complete